MTKEVFICDEELDDGTWQERPSFCRTQGCVEAVRKSTNCRTTKYEEIPLKEKVRAGLNADLFRLEKRIYTREQLIEKILSCQLMKSYFAEPYAKQEKIKLLKKIKRELLDRHTVDKELAELEAKLLHGDSKIKAKGILQETRQK